MTDSTGLCDCTAVKSDKILCLFQLATCRREISPHETSDEGNSDSSLFFPALPLFHHYLLSASVSFSAPRDASLCVAAGSTTNTCVCSPYRDLISTYPLRNELKKKDQHLYFQRQARERKCKTDWQSNRLQNIKKSCFYFIHLFVSVSPSISVSPSWSTQGEKWNPLFTLGGEFISACTKHTMVCVCVCTMHVCVCVRRFSLSISAPLFW